MKRLLIIIMLLPIFLFASPYANPYLYEDLMNHEYVAWHAELISYKNAGGKQEIIVAPYIVDAYAVYQNEEKWRNLFSSCGPTCLLDGSTSSIPIAYEHFFYRNATVPYLSGMLIKVTPGENIEYINQNKQIKYEWKNDNKRLEVSITDISAPDKKKESIIFYNSSTSNNVAISIDLDELYHYVM